MSNQPHHTRINEVLKEVSPEERKAILGRVLADYAESEREPLAALHGVSLEATRIIALGYAESVYRRRALAVSQRNQ